MKNPERLENLKPAKRVIINLASERGVGILAALERINAHAKLLNNIDPFPMSGGLACANLVFVANLVFLFNRLVFLAAGRL